MQVHMRIRVLRRSWRCRCTPLYGRPSHGCCLIAVHARARWTGPAWLEPHGDHDRRLDGRQAGAGLGCRLVERCTLRECPRRRRSRRASSTSTSGASPRRDPRRLVRPTRDVKSGAVKASRKVNLIWPSMAIAGDVLVVAGLSDAGLTVEGLNRYSLAVKWRVTPLQKDRFSFSGGPSVGVDAGQVVVTQNSIRNQGGVVERAALPQPCDGRHRAPDICCQHRRPVIKGSARRASRAG